MHTSSLVLSAIIFVVHLTADQGEAGEVYCCELRASKTKPFPHLQELRQPRVRVGVPNAVKSVIKKGAVSHSFT